VEVLQALVRDLRDRGKVDLRESFIDGSFAGAKRGSGVGKTKCGKGTKIMAIADRHGLPIGISAASASPHENQARRTDLEQRFTKEVPAFAYREQSV